MKTFQICFVSSICILLSILILTVVVIFLFNKSIMSSDSPKELGLIVQTLMPPKDLYDYLINEDLDISKKDTIKSFEFKNIYEGRHDVGILLDKFTDDLYSVSISQRYKLKLKMEVKFYVNNLLVLSDIVEKNYDPFIGRTGRGFSFITYNSPKDLPLNKLIKCEVKIIEPDNVLTTVYGPVRFYIKKMSDK